MAKITYQLLQKPIEERIIDAACIYWEVDRPYFSMVDCVNQSTVVYRKSIIYYLMKQNTTLSLKEMANKLGFVAHMPVTRSIENIDALKGVYKETNNDLNQIQHLADMLVSDCIIKEITLVNNKLQLS